MNMAWRQPCNSCSSTVDIIVLFKAVFASRPAVGIVSFVRRLHVWPVHHAREFVVVWFYSSFVSPQAVEFRIEITERSNFTNTARG